MNLHPLKLYHGLFGPAVGPTMLGVVASVLAVVCKRMQQFPTMLAYHRCWSITRSYCVAVYKEIVCNDRTWPQKCWKAVQTDPTLLLYASAIMEQKKCIEFLAQKFARFQTLRNNYQQHATTCNRLYKRTQHVTSNNVATVCAGL